MAATHALAVESSRERESEGAPSLSRCLSLSPRRPVSRRNAGRRVGRELGSSSLSCAAKAAAKRSGGRSQRAGFGGRGASLAGCAAAGASEAGGPALGVETLGAIDDIVGQVTRGSEPRSSAERQPSEEGPLERRADGRARASCMPSRPRSVQVRERERRVQQPSASRSSARLTPSQVGPLEQLPHDRGDSRPCAEPPPHKART